MSAGSTTECMFRAFDARGGKMLWETTPALFGMHGVSSSCLVNGEQCIAMPSGWGVDGERLLDATNALFDIMTMVPQGSALTVRKLKQ